MEIERVGLKLPPKEPQNKFNVKTKIEGFLKMEDLHNGSFIFYDHTSYLLSLLCNLLSDSTLNDIRQCYSTLTSIEIEKAKAKRLCILVKITTCLGKWMDLGQHWWYLVLTWFLVPTNLFLRVWTLLPIIKWLQNKWVNIWKFYASNSMIFWKKIPEMIPLEFYIFFK